MLAALAVFALGGLAHAEPPVLSPSAEPSDITTWYRTYAVGEGRTGPASELACRELAEGLNLCFTWDEGDVRRYVTRAELAAWGVDLVQVEAQASSHASLGFSAGRPAALRLDGIDRPYFASNEGDGLDTAALLLPDRLFDAVGPGAVLAVPAKNSLLAWIPGDSELDKIMAVGVLKAYEQAPHPVSPKIYEWDSATHRWRVWGEAVPRP